MIARLSHLLLWVERCFVVDSDDVMLMSYAVDCGRMNAHDLRGMVKQYVSAEIEPLKLVQNT